MIASLITVTCRIDLETKIVCQRDSGTVTPPVDVGSTTSRTRSSLRVCSVRPTSPPTAAGESREAVLSATEDCRRSDGELRTARDDSPRSPRVKTNPIRRRPTAAPAKNCERFARDAFVSLLRSSLHGKVFGEDGENTEEFQSAAVASPQCQMNFLSITRTVLQAKNTRVSDQSAVDR